MRSRTVFWRSATAILRAVMLSDASASGEAAVRAGVGMLVVPWCLSNPALRRAATSSTLPRPFSYTPQD